LFISLSISSSVGEASGDGTAYGIIGFAVAVVVAAVGMAEAAAVAADHDKVVVEDRIGLGTIPALVPIMCRGMDGAEDGCSGMEIRIGKSIGLLGDPPPLPISSSSSSTSLSSPPLRVKRCCCCCFITVTAVVAVVAAAEEDEDVGGNASNGLGVMPAIGKCDCYCCCWLSFFSSPPPSTSRMILYTRVNFHQQTAAILTTNDMGLSKDKCSGKECYRALS
jgi:hypothetical protein